MFWILRHETELSPRIFAFIHIRAFTYKPYRPYHSQRSNQSPPSPTPRLRSLAHAMDFRETFREIWHGCIYLWERVRGKEPTTDIGAKRAAHYESAFGRKRASPSNQQNLGKQINLEDDSDLTRLTRLPHHTPVEIEGALVIEGEKEWLRMDDSYDYDLDYSGRDLGEGLNTHLKREKQQRRSNSRKPKSTICHQFLQLMMFHRYRPRRSGTSHKP